MSYPKPICDLDLKVFTKVKEFGDLKVGQKVKVKTAALSAYPWPSFPEFFDLLELWEGPNGVSALVGDPRYMESNPCFSIHAINTCFLVKL